MITPKPMPVHETDEAKETKNFPYPIPRKRPIIGPGLRQMMNSKKGDSK